MQRKYGHQPVKNFIVNDGRTIAGFVRSLRSDNRHALFAIDGRCSPSGELRVELSTRLGVPIELLFTKAALDAEYHGPRGRLVRR